MSRLLWTLTAVENASRFPRALDALRASTSAHSSAAAAKIPQEFIPFPGVHGVGVGLKGALNILRTPIHN
jgi:hypothetical protein